MTEPIRAKVARILNSREVVLNAGSEKGVAVGMDFDIMDTKGEDIRDPDTNEVLGSVERPKVRVRVTAVKERMCVASTFRKKKVNVGGIGPDLGVFSRSLLPRQYVSRYETLKTDEKTWEDLDESESYVKTGDPAVQVIDVQPEPTTTEGGDA